MSKRITKRAERSYDHKIIRDHRGVMLNPLMREAWEVAAKKKLAYAVNKIQRLEKRFSAVHWTLPEWQHLHSQILHLEEGLFGDQ